MRVIDKIKNMNACEFANFLEHDIYAKASCKVCSDLCRHTDALGRCTVERCYLTDRTIMRMYLESEV